CEDVVARLCRLRLLELGRCNNADEGRLVAIRFRGDNATVLLQQSSGQRRFGLPDASTQFIVELHWEVSNSSGRDIRGNINLLASHNSHINNRFTSLGKEPKVGRRQAGGFKFRHESSE